MTAILKPRKILIVDDDEFNSQAVADRLERRGLSVKVVTDQVQILEVLEHEKIELVLLDIVMPTVDGLTLLRRIREKYSKNEIPVIMATAVNDSFDVVNAFKDGASDYITKPINIDVATARINAQLSFVDLYKIEIVQKELEAIKAVVTTYNHEINTPLAVALLSLHSVRKNSKAFDIKNLDQAEMAMNKISEIVKKIQELTKNKSIDFDGYAGLSKKVKLNK